MGRRSQSWLECHENGNDTLAADAIEILFT